ncbi:carboxypeptidase-like regulatory domain-containing protein [Flavobacterium sp. ZS1P14]|uniref:carboxypeptidase-like regulatory domain-containing protein n=1 Tax=Flavobacterium sp. ZS1P14 TaxID=3401729 RepID=UPI003AAE4D89
MQKKKKNVNYFLFLLGILFCLPIYGQEALNVKGTVTDAKLGGALPGVSILIKGTAKGTTADFDGNYTISAKPNDVLVFSYIGFKTIQMPLGGKTKINISLEAENNVLDEIVVVGYGTAKRRDLTGSVASVKGKDLAAYPVANVAQALQGKIAGVNPSCRSLARTATVYK